MELSRTRRIGFQHERDLARKLWSKGFAVMRAPASGSKAKHTVYPDLVAIKNKHILVFEVKTMHKPRSIYIPRERIDRMNEFIKRSNGIGYIAVKIIGSGEWRFIPLSELELTPSGNYKVLKDKIESGLRLRDLVNMVESQSTIDDYLRRDHDSLGQ